MSVNALLQPNDYYNVYCHSINVDGHIGAVEITGTQGIVVTPNPIVDEGVVSLVSRLQEASGNVSIGNTALFSVSSGASNTSCGFNALNLLQSGNSNVAVGYGSADALVGGSNNVSVGTNSLTNSTDGVFTTSIGNSSASTYSNYSHCTFLGADTDSSSNGLVNATAIGYNAKVNQNNSLVLGVADQKVGLGIPIPNSNFSFLGGYQQSAFGTAHNSVTDLKKGQDVRSQLRDSGTGNITLFSLVIPVGNSPSLLVATFVSVGILFQSVRGLDGAFGLCYGNTSPYSIGVFYDVVGNAYSFINNGETNVTLVNSGISNPLSSGCSWQIAGNILSLVSTTPTQFALDTVYSEVNYEYFSTQQ